MVNIPLFAGFLATAGGDHRILFRQHYFGMGCMLRNPGRSPCSTASFALSSAWEFPPDSADFVQATKKSSGVKNDLLIFPNCWIAYKKYYDFFPRA